LFFEQQIFFFTTTTKLVHQSTAKFFEFQTVFKPFIYECLEQFKALFEGLNFKKIIYFSLKILTLRAQNFEKILLILRCFLNNKFFLHGKCKKLQEILVVSQIVKIIFANTLSAFPRNMGRNPTLQHILIFHQNLFFHDKCKKPKLGKKRMDWFMSDRHVMPHGMTCWHAFSEHSLNFYIWLTWHGMLACHLYLTGMAWHGMACFGLMARKVKMRRIASHVRRNASQNARFRGSNASHATRRVAKVVFCQGGLFFATHCVALRHIASHCNALRRIASQYCSFYFFLWLKTEKSSHVCRSFVLGEESKFGFKNTFSDTCIFFSCWSILMSTVPKLFSLEKRIHCMTLEHPQMGQYYQKLTKQTCKNWKIYQISRKVKINPSYFSKK